jgi:phosphoribosylaminoimidazole-succinocarboxamide synthase
LTSSPPVLETDLPTLTLYRRGKVRDVYVVDADHLLIVATDRISAFDYVLGSGIPDKGKVLTQLSAFWFDLLRDVVPNHLVAVDVAKYPASLAPYADLLRDRSMLVRRTEPLPVECVARGYISGSGWKDYQATGQICGLTLPAGLRESDRLPAPIFTPATKAQSGHDENISDAQAAEILGRDLLTQVKSLTLQLYTRGSAHAAAHGILLADTKFEFGIIQQGGRREVLLIDEVLTPDSSRFWPADAYTPGRAQPSYDKQFVRDYLESIKWNKQPPVPALPGEVVVRTRAKYLEAFKRLTGRELGA